jgi:hypothetical protein
MDPADPAEGMKVDRSAFAVVSLTAPDDSVAWWRSRSIGERLQGIELLRRTFYGDSETGGRLQRVLEVAQLKEI